MLPVCCPGLRGGIRLGCIRPVLGIVPGGHELDNPRARCLDHQRVELNFGQRLHLFVFLGRRADRCKILFWDRGGLVVYYKRLEKGRFRAPRLAHDGRSIEMDATELAMLLNGIDVRRVRRPEHWQPPAPETE